MFKNILSDAFNEESLNWDSHKVKSARLLRTFSKQLSETPPEAISSVTVLVCRKDGSGWFDSYHLGTTDAQVLASTKTTIQDTLNYLNFISRNLSIKESV